MCLCVCLSVLVAGRQTGGLQMPVRLRVCKVPPFDRVSIQSQWAGSKPARQAAARPSTGAVQEVSLIHMALSCKWIHPRLNNSWNFYVCSLAFFFLHFPPFPYFSLPFLLFPSSNLPLPVFTKSLTKHSKLFRLASFIVPTLKCVGAIERECKEEWA